MNFQSRQISIQENHPGVALPPTFCTGLNHDSRCPVVAAFQSFGGRRSAWYFGFAPLRWFSARGFRVLARFQQPVHLTLPKERVFRVWRRWRAKVLSSGSVQVTAAQVTRIVGATQLSAIGTPIIRFFLRFNFRVYGKAAKLVH